MKILVTGSSGFVGKNIVSKLSKNFEIFGLSRSQSETTTLVKDLLDSSLQKVLDNISPEVIIHCAAHPNVDYCEEYPDEAYKQNVTTTQNLVDWARKNNAVFVFISTDYVYPGGKAPNNEHSPVHPLNMYGKTKLEAENLVKKLEKYIILRTTGIFGYDKGGKNFLMQILNNRSPRPVPTDQISNPTDIDLLVRSITVLLKKKQYGLFVAAGPDHMSRAEFALLISNVFKIDKSLIKPVKTSELNQKAQRPLTNILDSSKIYAIIGGNIPTVKESLEKISRAVNL